MYSDQETNQSAYSVIFIVKPILALSKSHPLGTKPITLRQAIQPQNLFVFKVLEKRAQQAPFFSKRLSKRRRKNEPKPTAAVVDTYHEAPLAQMVWK